MTTPPPEAIEAAAWAIHNERVYHAGGNVSCKCLECPAWDLRAAELALKAAAPHMTGIPAVAHKDATDRAYALGYRNGAATEYDRIIQLVTDHGATYFGEPRPCDCHRADCAVIVRERIPVADLIRKERGNE